MKNKTTRIVHISVNVPAYFELEVSLGEDENAVIECIRRQSVDMNVRGLEECLNEEDFQEIELALASAKSAKETE